MVVGSQLLRDPPPPLAFSQSRPGLEITINPHPRQRPPLSQTSVSVGPLLS